MRSILMLVVGLMTIGCAAPEADIADQPPVEEVETGYAEFGQSRIYYEIRGQGSPVILIHGGLLNSKMWDDQFEVFAEHYRVIRYDASSHGRSATPPDAYHDHEDLAALMDALEIERAVIMGLSMGGRIAIDIALEHPDRVAAVVAVGPGLGGYRFDSDEVTAGRQELNEAWGNQEWDRVVEAFQRSWTDGPYRSPEEVDAGVREKVRVMIRETMNRAPAGEVTEGRTMRPPAVDRLKELSLPMLVVVGELDMPDIHEIADLLLAANPIASKTVVGGVAHVVNMENPVEFNRIALEFLGSLPAP
jgi:pimeloyl-ACP methyl ester carboxylesterase